MDEVYEKHSKPTEINDQETHSHHSHHSQKKRDSIIETDNSPVNQERRKSLSEIQHSEGTHNAYGDDIINGILKENMGGYSKGTSSSTNMSREEIIQKKMQELKDLGLSSNEVLAKFNLLL